MLIYSAGTRTFVHEKIFDAFVAEATKLANNRKVGSPFDASTAQGEHQSQCMIYVTD